MILICSNIALIRFLGGVSLTMTLEVSFLSFMTKLVGGILVGRQQLPKSFSVVCIGRLCLKMLIGIVRVS